MTETHIPSTGRLSTALRCALQSFAIVLVLLLPFLNSPFTIDDPLYLMEAQHAVDDPLHPQAFDVVWSMDLELRASQILPGGLAVPYLLIPTILTGAAEWAGHLTQIIELLLALFGSALLAVRLGLDRKMAGAAVLLVATSPAVLGMAGTVMPDVAAMLFVVLGMERLVAWREDRKWPQAVLASVWLTLAALTRTQTILILVAGFVILLDGITWKEIAASFRRFRVRFLPVVVPILLFGLVSALTDDPERTGTTLLSLVLTGLPQLAHLVKQNASAFLVHWVIVVPLTIPWWALRYRQLLFSRIEGMSVLFVLFCSVAASYRYGWAAVAAAVSLIALADIAVDAIARRDRVQLALWLSLLLAIPAVIYVHLPAKYLLPSAPGAAILIARHLPELEARLRRWLVPSLAFAGTVLGLLILLAGRDLAEGQRRAAAELVAPHIKSGENVWFAGHWGFQWYAADAGARPVTLRPPFPRPGDIVVVSFVDIPLFADHWTNRQVIQRISYDQPGGRVMDLNQDVGFFSNSFGYLPWAWGSDQPNQFEVWRVGPATSNLLK